LKNAKMIEITPVKNLDSSVSVPGSKYIANRLLIICALADGISTLKNVPDNKDINNAINAIKQFGIKIEKNSNALTIHGTNGRLHSSRNKINVGDSGTLLRFIAGFAALAKGKTKITGSKRMQERPISDLLKSLTDLGVKCESANKHAPIEILGGTFKGGKTSINGSISSQFISSLLMISPFAKEDVEISVNGKLASSEYIGLTISLMKKFGVKIENNNNRVFKIKSNQKYKSGNFTIQSDWASANYFLAAAAIVPGKVRINNLNFKLKQPESGFYKVLERMGCKIKLKENSIEITGDNKLKAIEADMSSMPDSAQTLAVAALFAGGTTKITGISNLRFKESDRINDTAAELRKLGAKADVKNGELIILPSKLKSAEINPHNDHRMAMSFAIAGLKIPGIKIGNPECVNKSFPAFFEKIHEMQKNNEDLTNDNIKINIVNTRDDLKQVFRIRDIVFIDEQKV